MKQLDFHEVGPAFSDQQLLALEKRVGFNLPVDLVTFLKRNNGGRPLYCEFLVPGIDDPIDFHEVIGIGERKGIEYWLDEYNSPYHEQEFPEQMIPIGYETYGNCILVKHDGGVYYWDIEGHYGDELATNIYKVNDSFSAFIDSLERIVL